MLASLLLFLADEMQKTMIDHSPIWLHGAGWGFEFIKDVASDGDFAFYTGYDVLNVFWVE